ncbi:hypothetical protein [Synechococcus phage S-H68]|nr:hypothetical protein [Synechococcus phage S-H68]
MGSIPSSPIGQFNYCPLDSQGQNPYTTKVNTQDNDNHF